MTGFEKSSSRFSDLAALLTAVLIGAVVLVAYPSQLEANWNFDPECSTVEISEADTPATPNALLMLDQSGSMGSLTDGDGNSLWSVAVGAIEDAVNILSDDLRFGLGLFPASDPDSDCYELCILWLCATFCDERSGAEEVVPAGDDTEEVITEVLNETGPDGGTPTWAALDAIRTSQSMNEAGRPAGGVLITDGQPCCHSSARDDTIEAACQLRDEGYTTYVVGLGGATDQDFNNKMAAALGTGCCGPDANEDCTNGLGADPCSSSVDATACHGAYHANNHTEFRNVLLSIGDEIACTFPIDTSLRNDGRAPDDPEGTRVEIFGPSGWETIEHRDSSEDGEGWYFSNPDNRDQVTLTNEYCSMIQAGHIHEVATQAACECQQLEGAECTNESPPPGTCSAGTWYCEKGYDLCDPLPLEDCPEDCPGYQDLIGENCLTGASADEIAGLDPAQWQTPTSRCDVGEVVCHTGAVEPVCEAQLRPMPEICDGMDNSCDGKLDNITESWADWYESENWEEWVEGRDWDDGNSHNWSELPAGFELPDSYRGATCGVEDICRCEDGASQVHLGSGETIEEEFDDYLSSRPETCQCVPPLRP